MYLILKYFEINSDCLMKMEEKQMKGFGENMVSETLKEFLEDYHGFDFENGEIVIVDQRTGKNFICKLVGKKLRSATFHDFTAEYERSVWSWTHTQNTMLIVI